MASSNVSDQEFMDAQKKILDLRLEKFEILEREKNLRKEHTLAQQQVKLLSQSTEEYDLQTSALRRNIDLLVQQNDALSVEVQALKDKLSEHPTPTQPSQSSGGQPPQHPQQPNEELQHKYKAQQQDMDRVLQKMSEREIQNSQLQANVESQKQMVGKLQRQLQDMDVHYKKQLHLATVDASNLNNSITDLKHQLEISSKNNQKYITALNQSNQAQDELRQQIIKRDELIKLHDDETHSINSLKQHISKLTAECSSKTEQLSIKSQEYDAIRSQFEHSKTEKERLLGKIRQTEDITADRERDLAKLERERNSMVKKFEKERTVMKEEIEASQAKFDERCDELTSKMHSLELELQKKTDQINELESDLQAAQTKLSEHQTQTEHAEKNLNTELEELRQKMKDSEKQLKDKGVEHKIEQRKRNQMVKELKSQLKREALRAKTLEANLTAMEDEIKTKWRNPVHHSVIHSTTMKKPPPPPSVPRPTNRPRTHSLPGTGSSRPRPGQTNIGQTISNSTNHNSLHRPPPPTTRRQDSLSRHPHRSSATHIVSNTGIVHSSSHSKLNGVVVPPSVETEVSQALANRLASSQDTNYHLKQRISYLETAMQELMDELDKKRKVITNFARRIETGALTTNEFDMNRKRDTNIDNAEAREALLRKMEVIMEETSLQNEVLRTAKEDMGKEIQRLYKLNQTLLKEHAAEFDSPNHTRKPSLEGSIDGSLGSFDSEQQEDVLP